MNKKTIIFITVHPFNEDYALKLGFDILKNRGFEIVVFIVYEILFRETVKEYKRIFAHGSQIGPVFGINQFEVKSVKDLRICCNDIEGWKIAILMCHPYLSILKVLKKAKVGYVRKFSNMAPPIKPVTQRGYIREIIRVLRLFVSFRRLFFYATNKIMPIFPRLFNVEPPEYVIVVSAASVPSYILSKTKVIYTHSFDYDRYLRNKDKPRPKIVPDEDYYVYIPCIFGYGLSGISEKRRPLLSMNELVEIINRFLGFVEKMTGKKILIAPHPKYASSEWNLYEGRPFIGFETEQLIKYSSGVLSHGSFAIKFAIIHEKPLGFLAIRSFGHHNEQNLFCKAQASALGGRVHYIDTDDDLCQLMEEGMMSYNPDLYGDYKRKYIKCDNSMDRLYWEVVADELLDEKVMQ